MGAVMKPSSISSSESTAGWEESLKLKHLQTTQWGGGSAGLVLGVDGEVGIVDPW